MIDVRKSLVGMSALVVISLVPFAAVYAEDASRTSGDSAVSPAPNTDYIRGPDGKLMDHSPADPKSMRNMKKASPSDAGKAKDEKPVEYIKSPDGKLMDHSPADPKSMRNMKSDKKNPSQGDTAK